MWVKLDDRFATNPKVAGLSDRAFRGHVSALCHCGQHLTDGHVDKATARRILTPRYVDELGASGLWIADPGGGFWIKDYLEFNPSRAEVEACRDGGRSRTKRWREAKGA